MAYFPKKDDKTSIQDITPVKIAVTRPTTVQERQKSQFVRLFDVFVIAPALIYAGMQDKRLKRSWRSALVWMGAGTAVYNGINYLDNLKKQKQGL